MISFSDFFRRNGALGDGINLSKASFLVLFFLTPA